MFTCSIPRIFEDVLINQFDAYSEFMIEKITIQNFKSIVDLDLELGQLNVFIGENGCGKTNILEAVAFGSAGLEKTIHHEMLSVYKGVRVTDIELMCSKFKNSASGIGKAINLLFYGKNDDSIQVELYPLNETEWHSFVYEPKLKNMVLTEMGDFSKEKLVEIFDILLSKDINSIDSDKIKSDIFAKMLLNNALFNKIQKFKEYNLSDFAIFCPENYFLRRFEEEGQLRPIGIRGEGLFKHLVTLYKKDPEILVKIGEGLRLIGWFEGFEIPKDLMFTEKRINIKDKYLQELDFFDQRSANEGFLYLLFYFTLFLSPDTPKFFAIDNIDNALNPKLGAELIRQLAAICKENGKQVMLTTHNPAVLDGLDLDDDSQRLFSVYRNADGHTSVKRIKAPKKINGKEPVRLSEAFIRGYLGGLPKNF